MVSAWWLIVMFMAGGTSGVLVMALMHLASDPARDQAMPPATHWRAARASRVPCAPLRPRVGTSPPR